jgi:hypothetical protein
MRYLGENEAMQMDGIGYVGEVAQGDDGMLYEWVEGIDGLGNAVGFWKRLKRFTRRALPFVQRVASFIPHPYAQAVAQGLTVATPVLQRAGVAGNGGLGALYEASDGTVYQMQGVSERDDLNGYLAEDDLKGFEDGEDLQGIDEDPDLNGLDADEELQGFAEDDELRGMDEDQELQGFSEDHELRGVAADEDLQGMAAEDDLSGFSADDELQGLEQGYVREDGVEGVDAYVPQQAPATRWFTEPTQPPALWKPLW